MSILPDELYTSILSNLTPSALLKTSTASHTFNSLARQNNLWYQIYQSRPEGCPGNTTSPIPDFNPKLSYYHQYKYCHSPLQPLGFHSEDDKADVRAWNLAYQSEQKLIASAYRENDQIQFWRKREDGFHFVRRMDVERANCGRGLPQNPPKDYSRSQGIEFTADGKSLAYAWRGCVQLYDLETSKLTHTTGQIHKGAIPAIRQIDETGRLFASGSGDKTIKLFDIRSNETITTFEQDGTVLALSKLETPNGNGILVSGGRFNNLTTFDLGSRNVIEAKFTGTFPPLYPVSQHPNPSHPLPLHPHPGKTTQAITTSPLHPTTIHTTATPIRNTIQSHIHTYTLTPTQTLHLSTKTPISASPSSISFSTPKSPFTVATLNGDVDLLSPAYQAGADGTDAVVEWRHSKTLVQLDGPIMSVVDGGEEGWVCVGGARGIKASEFGRGEKGKRDVGRRGKRRSGEAARAGGSGSGGSEMVQGEEGSEEEEEGLLGMLRRLNGPFRL
ncbi:hypothetical protein HK097_011133 [Rhizophlyctis rosea]|uniref:F-box domain-containing protein n=1 Tax=Rhizophlyctis rosea TaxID=64517 RepID=A0AAD5S9H3_9FUNG|nr:hypothetical protein HK097_011133 [Rhizophlyctis rosea]